MIIKVLHSAQEARLFRVVLTGQQDGRADVSRGRPQRKCRGVEVRIPNVTGEWLWVYERHG